MFSSKRSASFVSMRPRSPGVTFLHSPSNALRAADTAMSTSFSEASWTEQMTLSSEGLMTSNVLPSTPFTNSLLMKLASGQWVSGASRVHGASLTVRWAARTRRCAAS